MTDLPQTQEWREAREDIAMAIARVIAERRLDGRSQPCVNDQRRHEADAALTAALPHLRKLIEDQHETMLLGVIADVRAAAGVGHKPMLDELADAVAQYEIGALKVQGQRMRDALERIEGDAGMRLACDVEVMTGVLEASFRRIQSEATTALASAPAPANPPGLPDGWKKALSAARIQIMATADDLSMHSSAMAVIDQIDALLGPTPGGDVLAAAAPEGSL